MDQAIDRRPVRQNHVATWLPGAAVVPASSYREWRIRRLDPVGSRVWDLADGRHTVGEIAAVLADEVGVSVGLAQGCVDTLVAELVDCGFLAWA